MDLGDVSVSDWSEADVIVIRYRQYHLSGGKVNGVMYAEGLPLVDEGTYSFSIFCDDSSQTGEFAMMPILQDQTNVEVELQIYPNETATERLNLALNSGDYADVLGGWILNDSLILTYGVNQGVFLPDPGLRPVHRPEVAVRPADGILHGIAGLEA